VSIPQIFREYGFYLDHWHDPEDPRFYHGRIEKESRLVDDDRFHEVSLDPSYWESWVRESRGWAKAERVILMDGVRRIHRRLCDEYGSAAGCIAEIVVGHMLWSEKGVIPCLNPQIRRVLVLPTFRMPKLKDIEAYFPSPMGFKFDIVELESGGEDSISKTVDNLLLAEEGEYLKKLFLKGEAFILKDGTMHPGFPSFAGHLHGPIGLVKRVLREHLPEDLLSLVIKLPKGARTPFYVAYVREKEDILRVMCYLRIMDPDPFGSPMMGVVRLETLVKRVDFESDEERDRLKKEISMAFDMVAGFASSMTIKGCDLPRTPENLPIVFSLEKWLSSFFLPTDCLNAFLKGGV